MSQGRIVVITGSPGTGKSTTASLVAKESDMDKSVHMRTDDFWKTSGIRCVSKLFGGYRNKTTD